MWNDKESIVGGNLSQQLEENEKSRAFVSSSLSSVSFGPIHFSHDASYRAVWMSSTIFEMLSMSSGSICSFLFVEDVVFSSYLNETSTAALTYDP